MYFIDWPCQPKSGLEEYGRLGILGGDFWGVDLNLDRSSGEEEEDPLGELEETGQGKGNE